MMLTHLGEIEAGAAVDRAVGQVAGSLPSLRAGRMEASTSEVGDRVSDLISAVVSAEAV